MALFFYQTPIGKIALRENGQSITSIFLRDKALTPDEFPHETPLLREAIDQIRRYFAGSLRAFDLPISPEGTPFMKRVWEELRQIPYGKTQSYGAVAKALAMPRAARAVGMANGRNPIPIIIPCHRVIGADGSLAGFSSGLEIKAALLQLEQKYSADRF